MKNWIFKIRRKLALWIYPGSFMEVNDGIFRNKDKNAVLKIEVIGGGGGGVGREPGGIGRLEIEKWEQ